MSTALEIRVNDFSSDEPYDYGGVQVSLEPALYTRGGDVDDEAAYFAYVRDCSDILARVAARLLDVLPSRASSSYGRVSDDSWMATRTGATIEQQNLIATRGTLWAYGLDDYPGNGMLVDVGVEWIRKPTKKQRTEAADLLTRILTAALDDVVAQMAEHYAPTAVAAAPPRAVAPQPPDDPATPQHDGSEHDA